MFAVAYSREVASFLDLDSSECERPEFALIMSGSAPLPGRSVQICWVTAGIGLQEWLTTLFAVTSAKLHDTLP